MRVFTFLLILILLVGCKAQHEVDNGQVVAVVKGTEITLKDVRANYYVEDEDVPDMIKEYVKEEVLVHEAKKNQYDITKDLKLLEENSIEGNQAFIKRQADYLDITEETYIADYFSEKLERNVYINHLLESQMERMEADLDPEAFTLEIENYIDSVLDSYEDDITIYE